MNKVKTTPLRVYKHYVAIKSHYTNEKYDYYLNRGHTKASLKSYEKRRDKHFFEMLSRKEHWFDYIISNIAYDDYWIGDILLNSDAELNAQKYRARKQALSYIIKQDYKQLNPDFKSNFLKKNDHPKILQLYVDGEITLETISVLSKMVSSYNYWDKVMEEDILWLTHRIKIMKHHRFFKPNYDKIREIVLANQ